MNVTAYQEKEKNEETKTGNRTAEERENRRPISKKLCAVLLQSFRGKHIQKIKGSVRGNCIPREGQQPFRPNPNVVGDCTTTMMRLLIDAVVSLWLRCMLLFGHSMKKGYAFSKVI